MSSVQQLKKFAKRIGIGYLTPNPKERESDNTRGLVLDFGDGMMNASAMFPDHDGDGGVDCDVSRLCSGDQPDSYLLGYRGRARIW